MRHEKLWPFSPIGAVLKLNNLKINQIRLCYIDKSLNPKYSCVSFSDQNNNLFHLGVSGC